MYVLNENNKSDLVQFDELPVIIIYIRFPCYWDLVIFPELIY